MKLPKHIIKAIDTNKTSLGDNPAYPPEEEDTFVYKIVKHRFEEVSSDLDTDDVDALKSKLSSYITKVKKIEEANKQTLEMLCINMVNDLFQIPTETLIIDASLVSSVNIDNQRIVPEATKEDFSFDDIDDFNVLTQEIYKRRMLNALVAGAAMYYANDISTYVSELFSINKELPFLYSEIVKINDYLLFIEKETLHHDKNTEAGKVDVNLGNSQNAVIIKSEALIFPVLVEETIKGILELAISHGLPTDAKKANYIMSKADFKLAEMWDMRLGYPLWERILKILHDNDINEEEVGINFIFMMIAQMKPEVFNDFMKEIFAHTKKGVNNICELALFIKHEKEQDDFNDYIQQKQNDTIQLDDAVFTKEELLAEDL